MAAPYTPSPPTGKGTDDYRCFLLDPDLPEDAWLTGTQILPGNPEVVHHVILFRVEESGVAAGRGRGRRSRPSRAGPASAAWASRASSTTSTTPRGWAPGRPVAARPSPARATASRWTATPGSSCRCTTTCCKGDQPDLSSTQIRWTPKAGSDIQGVHTTLLPAPVELPCRSEHALGALCDREASVEDAKERFGEGTGQLANLLHLLCGTNVYATSTTSCTREIPRAMTILGAAGHMHLLGQWIRIEANPGTPDAHRGARHPAVELRRPGRPAHRAAAPRRRRHPARHLPPHPGAARPAARLRRHAGEVRRLGRGHHRRDVPRHPPGRLRRRAAWSC